MLAYTYIEKGKFALVEKPTFATYSRKKWLTAETLYDVERLPNDREFLEI